MMLMMMVMMITTIIIIIILKITFCILQFYYLINYISVNIGLKKKRKLKYKNKVYSLVT